MMNPLQFFQMMRGGNPIQMLMNMAAQNPGLKNVMPLVQNQSGGLKSEADLKQVYENLCKTRGVDPVQFAQQNGLKFPG